MSEEIAQTVLAEIVKKITIEDGDILVVRTQDDSVLDLLGEIIKEMTGNSVLLIEESQLDILKGMSEDEMREYGWERIADD